MLSSGNVGMAHHKCDRRMVQGLAHEVRSRTGQVIDAYFSATKLQWLFKHILGLRQRAARGEIRFGTVDSWLVYQMTRGQLHIPDASNAARTRLYNIHNRTWDTTWLGPMQIPTGFFPRCIHHVMFVAMLGVELPIARIAGDQQATLFGQTCFMPGMAIHT
jgi:glycerol kinase